MPAFGGVAKVKNLFALPEDARAARHHMVSLMVTVLFDPDVTFGELVRDKTVREAWEAHRHRPDGEPKGRWEKIIDRAVDYMSQPSLADTNVRLLSEIQIIPSRFRDVREEMHEVYRIDRASDGQALWLDVHRVVTANICANDATTGAGPVMVIHKAEAPTTVYLAVRLAMRMWWSLSWLVIMTRMIDGRATTTRPCRWRLIEGMQTWWMCCCDMVL